MTKKVLLTFFLVIWLFSNTGSAQIQKHMDHQPSIKRL